MLLSPFIAFLRFFFLQLFSSFWEGPPDKLAGAFIFTCEF